MVITFYGEGCFKIQSGDFTILTDPITSQNGLTPPRFKSDIILKTLNPLTSVQQPNQTTQYYIYGPGEYNIKDINITGFGLLKESTEKFLKTIYLMEWEGVRLCFLGHISEMPEPTILEHLKEIEILFVPAGGPPFLSQNSAVKIIKQLEPKIIIPSFYKIPGLKRPAQDLKLFLEGFNGQKDKQIEPQEKLVVKKKNLASIKKTEIAVLKV